MTYNEYAFGSFETDIAAVAEQYDLNLDNLDVEFFSPGRQAILVEKIGDRRFRVHLNLEENRIIAVKQLDSASTENAGGDPFAKYKSFMK
jgi:hypothetical protein